jgi:hypothetical protein
MEASKVAAWRSAWKGRAMREGEPQTLARAEHSAIAENSSLPFLSTCKLHQ